MSNSKHTLEINDETIHKAFSKVKEKIRSKKELKKGYVELRKTITQTVRSCSDNVQVKIYIDEVLDDPIKITCGRGDNKLMITIDSEDGVEFTWTETTMAKAFWDGWGLGTDIAKRVVQTIAGFTGTAFQIATAPLAIANQK